MICFIPLTLLSFLFVTNNNGRGALRGGHELIPLKLARSNEGGTGRGRGRGRGRVTGRGRGSGRGGRGSESGRGGRGRNRYTRDGTKKKTSTDDAEFRQDEISPLPPLTKSNGIRPSYFTCRHTYEDTLMEEINKYSNQLGGQVIATSPYPGLVRVEDDDGILPPLYDPVYALQCIPNGVIVSAESIKGIAKEVIYSVLGNDDDDSYNDKTSLDLKETFRTAPRGSLAIHSLVPGMCKGQAKPVMQHRAEKIGEEMEKMLKKGFAAARKATNKDDDGNVDDPNNERWIMQMMLQSPNIALASLTKCKHMGPGQNSFWPNYYHPLGLPNVDIEEKMPSSAYRKLLEGIECMGISPSSTTTVVDLGACPGGWTKVMRRLDCRVVAVDRSELDPALMKDGMVDFIKGDAFTFEPTMVDEIQECWMISDVIAYPARTTEMMDQWCGARWASNMIVTMKFQGNEPDLDELQRARNIVEAHGYDCRVKHFFNNKNEVTFMVSRNDGTSTTILDGAPNASMFPVTLRN